MTIKSVIILGSRNLCVEYIKIFQDHKNFELFGVLPPPFKGWWDDPVNKYCNDNNIKIIKDIQESKILKPNFIISVNYWKLIPENIYDVFLTLNVHHSYRLKYRGRYSTSLAIINAKSNNYTHGTSIHRVSGNLDDGDLYFTDKIKFNEFDTAESLFERTEKLSIDLLKKNINNILDENFNSIEKDNDFVMFNKKDLNHDLTDIKDLDTLKTHVKALTFKNTPDPYFVIGNNKFLIKRDENN